MLARNEAIQRSQLAFPRLKLFETTKRQAVSPRKKWATISLSPSAAFLQLKTDTERVGLGRYPSHAGGRLQLNSQPTGAAGADVPKSSWRTGRETVVGGRVLKQARMHSGAAPVQKSDTNARQSDHTSTNPSRRSSSRKSAAIYLICPCGRANGARYITQLVLFASRKRPTTGYENRGRSHGLGVYH